MIYMDDNTDRTEHIEHEVGVVVTSIQHLVGVWESQLLKDWREGFTAEHAERLLSK